MTLIYHLAKQAAWAEAEAAGTYRGRPADRADGFLHFSTAAQIADSAAINRAGEADLILLAVPADGLGAALRWEPSRSGKLFPHLYGDLPLAQIAWARPLPLGPDGRHDFPPLDEAPS